MGTSLTNKHPCHYKKDHPHAYGDKLHLLRYGIVTLGSSPRVWGQVSSVGFPIACCRIIPTRMGTSTTLGVGVSLSEDHPHAYGDKPLYSSEYNHMPGSSPRVWGQVGVRFKDVALKRIIPTRMGTRLKKSRKIAVLQNQPLRFPLTFHRSFV